MSWLSCCSWPCLPVIYRRSMKIQATSPAGAGQSDELHCPSCGSIYPTKYVLMQPLTTLYFVIHISTGKQILKATCSVCNTVIEPGRFSKCRNCGALSSNACKFCTKCGQSK